MERKILCEEADIIMNFGIFCLTKFSVVKKELMLLLK